MRAAWRWSKNALLAALAAGSAFSSAATSDRAVVPAGLADAVATTPLIVRGVLTAAGPGRWRLDVAEVLKGEEARRLTVVTPGTRALGAVAGKPALLFLAHAGRGEVTPVLTAVAATPVAYRIGRDGRVDTAGRPTLASVRTMVAAAAIPDPDRFRKRIQGGIAPTVTN